MSILSINTTQNVNLAYKIGSIGNRILAFLLDAFLLGVYLFLLSLVIDVLESNIDNDWTIIGVVSLLSLPIMFYSIIMHSLFNGQTLGKMAMKLRVVHIEGKPLHWSHLLIRWMLRLVDIWLFMGAVGILAIVLTEKRQRLGDAAAGTVVIDVGQKINISHTILEDIEEKYVPTFTNVTTLTDSDIRKVKDAYRLAKDTKNYGMLKKLRTKLESLLHTNSDLYDMEYIETVLKDYNYYTQNF